MLQTSLRYKPSKLRKNTSAVGHIFFYAQAIRILRKKKGIVVEGAWFPIALTACHFLCLASPAFAWYTFRQYLLQHNRGYEDSTTKSWLAKLTAAGYLSVTKKPGTKINYYSITPEGLNILFELDKILKRCRFNK